jgi:hypothetical protein
MLVVLGADKSEKARSALEYYSARLKEAGITG